MTESGMQQIQRRRRTEKWFKYFCFSMTWLSVVVLVLLLADIAKDGVGRLSWSFLTQFPSRIPENAGIKAAIMGTLWLIGMTAAMAIPFGVAAAIYLEEYISPGKLKRLIDINLSNLAGVPSVIYGMLGLGIFVRVFGLGRNLLSGSLTLAVLVLPVIVIATQEALRSVPGSVRHAAYALGATKWKVTRDQVLPAAVPGIMTGIILAISRGIGETAPLLMIGAASFVSFVPEGPWDSFTTIPVQIFSWSSRPQPAFHELAAASIIVLLVMLFSLNVVAIWIRQVQQRKYRW